jgi:hypothetical protein
MVDILSSYYCGALNQGLLMLFEGALLLADPRIIFHQMCTGFNLVGNNIKR